jgi:iron(III) transport system ATP-binding protein
MAVKIKIRDAVKRYGDNTIISGLSLDIKEGEFFTLLGPSGCGKTTLLRMIAGFNSIEGGDFYFNDKRINDLDPAKRNIGMVFQNYAIFPHLTVEKNVSFGLTNRKYAKEKIVEETTKFLKLMQIEPFRTRLPERLSGGQQQRVALARALVIQPNVLLMDEPLSNLDAKLRVEMRTVIKDIQLNVGITTVYVTHDQEEAMAISDRIAIMKDGFIQHIGSPRAIYQRPANLFVASFIGTTNLIRAKVNFKNSKYNLVFDEKYQVEIDSLAAKPEPNSEVIVAVRPEEFSIELKSKTGLNAKIENISFLGVNTIYFARLDNGQRVEIQQPSLIEDKLKLGDSVRVVVDVSKINIFDAKSEVNLVKGIVNDLNAFKGK